MTRYEAFKQELLQNDEVRKEYEALKPEFDIIQAIIDGRKKLNLTQKQLSERTGITQADISRIENGTRNPSLAMLKRLAKGMGMQLRLEFVGVQDTNSYAPITEPQLLVNETSNSYGSKQG